MGKVIILLYFDSTVTFGYFLQHRQQVHVTLGLCMQALKEERGTKVPRWWWQEIKLKNPQNIATNKYIPKNSLHLGTLIYMMTSLRDALEIHSVHVSVTDGVSLWQAIHSPHLAAHYPTWQWSGGHRVREISCADWVLKICSHRRTHLLVLTWQIAGWAYERSCPPSWK